MTSVSVTAEFGACLDALNVAVPILFNQWRDQVSQFEATVSELEQLLGIGSVQ